MIPDFHLRSLTTPLLTKVTPRVDPSGTSTTIGTKPLFLLEFAYEIDLAQFPGDAANLDALLPGVSQVIQAIANNPVGKRKIDLTQEMGRFFASLQDPSGRFLFSAAQTEIMGITIRSNGPIIMMVVKVQSQNLPSQHIGDMLECLDRNVSVTLEPAQQRIVIQNAAVGTPMATGRSWGGVLGDLMWGTTKNGPDSYFICGIGKNIIELKDGKVVQLEEVDGSTSMLDVKDVDGFVTICPPPGEELPAVIERYVAESESAGSTPCYANLIKALTAALADGTLRANDSGHWMLTDQVIRSSIVNNVDIAA